MKHTPSNILCAIAGLGLAIASGQTQAALNIYESPTIAYDVSGNGQWAALATAGGSGGSNVHLWSAATQTLTNIGGFAGTGGGVYVSADGAVVAASTQDANGKFVSSIYEASTGQWRALPTLGGSVGSTASTTWALSANGRYVGGSAYLGSVSHGFIADTQTGAITDLGSTQARVQGINADASILTGYMGSGQNGSMWKRNADGSYTQSYLVSPDAPTTKLAATLGMSANGAWAVGASFNTSSSKPYRLNTETGQIQFFDKLAFANPSTGKATASPAAISQDGNTIVGIHTPTGALLSSSYGFIWKANGSSTGNVLGGSLMSFDDYLAGYGIDLDNHYNFVSVIGMNDNASVFSGIAKDNLTGNQVSFVVSVPMPVPEPGTYALLASGLAVLGAVGRRRKCRA